MNPYLFPFVLMLLLPICYADAIDLTHIQLTTPNGADHVRPGDSLRVSFDVENTADAAVADITISGVFRSAREGLLRDDDDDVMNLSTHIDSLREGTRAERSLTFTMPYAIRDTVEYELELTARGYTENRTAFSLTVPADSFTVDKLPHDLRFALLTLSSTAVQCGAQSELSLIVRNIGNDNEDATLIVEQQDLELSSRESFLIQKDYKKNNTYAKRLRFTVPEVSAGTYTIPVVVQYARGTVVLREDLSLDVSCDARSARQQPTQEPAPPTQPPAIEPATPSISQPPAQPTTTSPPAEPPVSTSASPNPLLIAAFAVGGLIVAVLLFLILYRLWKVRRIIG